jgi:hypothetical protein
MEWILWDTYVTFAELTGTVQTPAADNVRLYAKDKAGVSNLYFKDDAGVEHDLTGGGITGSGTSGQIAFFNGTSSVTSDSDLTFSTDTLTATKIIASTSLTLTGKTTGSVLFVGSSAVVTEDNANLFWDDTNNRLGIGINSSLQAPLHVKTAATLVARFDGSSSSAQMNIDYAQAGNNRWITYLEASATPSFRFFNTRRSKDAFVLDDTGSTIVGDQSALATNAVAGFIYIPTCAGTPTGTADTYTGKAPMVVDTTNSKLYVNFSGTWKSTTMA